MSGWKSIPVAEAQRRALDAVAPIDRTERVAVDACAGRVLAADVTAPFDVPPHDNSAMDGFAVRTADLTGDAPHRLRVAQVLPAGRTADRPVGPGEAVKIMTGAPLPPGADAVIMVERTEESGGCVVLQETPDPGRHVRPAGEDVRAGARVLPRGRALSPADAAVIASLGIARVEVYERPRLACLATGDELVAPGEPLGPGRIHDSNSTLMASLAREAGLAPVTLGVVRDDPTATRDRLREGLEADALMTSGAVSVGERDFVLPALREMGFEPLFHGVRMRPGGPVLFGLLERRPFFGLPGNPTSSLMAFQFIARPALWKLAGRADPLPVPLAIRLVETVRKAAGRNLWFRALVTQEEGSLVARSAGPQGSGILSTSIRANAVLDLPEEADEVPAGTVVPGYLMGPLPAGAPSSPTP
jgi:molybdopterin molybdotransferase